MSRNAKPVKNSVLLGDKKEAANGAVEAVAESGAATTTVDVDSEQKTQESSAATDRLVVSLQSEILGFDLITI